MQTTKAEKEVFSFRQKANLGLGEKFGMGRIAHLLQDPAHLLQTSPGLQLGGNLSFLLGGEVVAIERSLFAELQLV